MKTNPPSIEPLETRIAPAAVLVNATTFTYTDIDGDAVTVKTTGGPFVFTNGPNGDFGDSFVFNAANAIGGQQLVFVDLTLPGFAGEDLTFTVVKAGAGDGLAAVGYINAAGVDLGAITVKGDLNEIDAGDANTATRAIELLSVRSLGRYGDATDSLVLGLKSDIRGALGALRVAEDIKDASIEVTAAVAADAKIGSIVIGGSLIGGALGNSGSISTGGDIGPVKIGRDLIGGDGDGSGRIDATGNLGTVSIGGSMVGGSGSLSARVVSDGSMGAVTIAGNLQGGSATSSGTLRAGSKLASVTIGGSLLGGAGEFSARILSFTDLGPVQIAHDVKGGAGDDSGKIEAGGKITSIAIGGSLLGGSGDYQASGQRHQIFAAGGIGSFRVGHDVQGGAGDGSARVGGVGALGAISIGGSLLGGAGVTSGRFDSETSIGAVTIGHDLAGGSGVGSGAIQSDAAMASVSIGGSLIGGRGNFSGNISSDGALGPVKIGHDMIGGAGEFSGIIATGSIGAIGGAMAGVTIGGSLIGGSNVATGGISSEGTMAFVKISHDLVGGSITGTMPNLQGSGFIESDRRIGSVFIGGSIIAGTDDSTAGRLIFCATINAEDDIGALTVRGGLIGNSTSGVTISARGQATPGATTDLAIGRITIGGRVEFTRILAGYDDSDPASGVNADAQIGAVSVGADWIASSIVAGAVNLGANGVPGGADDNLRFGDFRDAKIVEAGESPTIVSRIGSIAIAGQVFGTPVSFSDVDRFGFVAEQIGSLKVGAKIFALTPGAGNDAIPLGYFSQSFGFTVSAHEIGTNFGSTVPTVAAPQRVNASTLAYTDVDGDRVVVSLSRPLLTDLAVANSVFTFDQGIVGGAAVSGGQQLQRIDLRALAAAGVNVTVSVVRAGGDGLAHIGAILADEDLGTITIPGDLGQIAAGDANAATRGLAALNVRTFGRLGTDTQPLSVAGFVPFVGGDILGSLGALTVRQDFAGADLAISGAVGTLTIGGSLIGSTTTLSGVIFTSGSIGAVRIGLHVQGGTGAASGLIDAGSSIASLSIGGSLLGGNVNADGTTLGPASVAHNVLGGSGGFTGGLTANTGVGNVTIGGSLVGGIGESSGRIFAAAGGIGAVKIGHNVVGGAGNDSGKIDSGAKIASVSIGGSLVGGDGDQSTFSSGGFFHRAQVFAIGNIGPVTIGHDVLGATGVASAAISTRGDLASVTVGGSVAGGAENDSARISAFGRIGPVKIAHGLLGDAGQNSGSVSADSITSVSIGGSLVGGTATAAGQINGRVSLGAVTIGHDVHGGSAVTSGYIVSDGKITSVSIGGSLVGGSANLTGGIFPSELGSVKIGRDLIGGSIAGTTATLERSGFIQAQNRIGSVSIGGSIIAGIDDSTGGELRTNGSIRTDGDLLALTVRGSLIGNVAPNGTTPVIISAQGEATPTATRDLAIGRIDIGGGVERALILAGYDTGVVASDTQAAHRNNKAQIGTVRVGGDWAASSLVAGILNLGNNFGDGSDVLGLLGGSGSTIARIASIVIGGTVTGTAGGSDHFGFSSVTIGSFKSRNFTAPLTPVHDPAIELSPITGDVTIREL